MSDVHKRVSLDFITFIQQKLSDNSKFKNPHHLDLLFSLPSGMWPEILLSALAPEIPRVAKPICTPFNPSSHRKKKEKILPGLPPSVRAPSIHWVAQSWPSPSLPSPRIRPPSSPPPLEKNLTRTSRLSVRALDIPWVAESRLFQHHPLLLGGQLKKNTTWHWREHTC